MAIIVADANALLNAELRATAYTGPATLYLSLHSGDPGTTGANEIVGGSYARIAIAFNAASGGQATNSAQLSFTNMPAVTVTHVGLWDIGSGGTASNFHWGAPLVGNFYVFTAATSDTITSPGHPFLVNNQVRAYAAPQNSSGFPTGLTQGTSYFIINPATDTFQLSATQGGAAVDITASGGGIIALNTQKAFAAGDTAQFAANTGLTVLES